MDLVPLDGIYVSAQVSLRGAVYGMRLCAFFIRVLMRSVQSLYRGYLQGRLGDMRILQVVHRFTSFVL
jgi:hypothetical protein